MVDLKASVKIPFQFMFMCINIFLNTQRMPNFIIGKKLWKTKTSYSVELVYLAMASRPSASGQHTCCLKVTEYLTNRGTAAPVRHVMQ